MCHELFYSAFFGTVKQFVFILRESDTNSTVNVHGILICCCHNPETNANRIILTNISLYHSYSFRFLFLVSSVVMEMNVKRVLNSHISREFRSESQRLGRLCNVRFNSTAEFLKAVTVKQNTYLHIFFAKKARNWI